MKISASQIQPTIGNISENILKHKKLIELATLQKSNLIFFPELSLTGYEPKLAKELATTPHDEIFNDLQKASTENNIIIGVGVPTKSSTGIHISMIFIHPNLIRETYSKQQLHSDELPYFIPGKKQIILSVNNTKVAPAICYESLQTNHSEIATQLGAEIYIASVAKSQSGLEKAILHYPSIAKKFAMPVLMSNCLGFCDDFQSVGQSSVWTKEGVLIRQLDSTQEGILTFNTETEEITEQTL